MTAAMTYRRVLDAALKPLERARARFLTRSKTRKIETMDKRAEYLSTMKTQLKKWDADVDALAAEGEKANVEARAAYHKHVAELRTERDAAHKTFEKFQLATEAAGAHMQEGMQVAWDTMQKALAKVSADLKK
jgi:hypothetical protein